MEIVEILRLKNLITFGQKVSGNLKAIALEICPKLTKNEPGYFLVEICWGKNLMIFGQKVRL